MFGLLVPSLHAGPGDRDDEKEKTVTATAIPSVSLAKPENPFGELSPADWDAARENGALAPLPFEMMRHIVSFMDRETRENFSKTCRWGYTCTQKAREKSWREKKEPDPRKVHIICAMGEVAHMCTRTLIQPQNSKQNFHALFDFLINNSDVAYYCLAGVKDLEYRRTTAKAARYAGYAYVHNTRQRGWRTLPDNANKGLFSYINATLSFPDVLKIWPKFWLYMLPDHLAPLYDRAQSVVEGVLHKREHILREWPDSVESKDIEHKELAPLISLCQSVVRHAVSACFSNAEADEPCETCAYIAHKEFDLSQPVVVPLENVPPTIKGLLYVLSFVRHAGLNPHIREDSAYHDPIKPVILTPAGKFVTRRLVKIISELHEEKVQAVFAQYVPPAEDQ